MGMPFLQISVPLYQRKIQKMSKNKNRNSLSLQRSNKNDIYIEERGYLSIKSFTPF